MALGSYGLPLLDTTMALGSYGLPLLGFADLGPKTKTKLAWRQPQGERERATRAGTLLYRAITIYGYKYIKTKTKLAWRQPQGERERATRAGTLLYRAITIYGYKYIGPQLTHRDTCRDVRGCLGINAEIPIGDTDV